MRHDLPRVHPQPGEQMLKEWLADWSSRLGIHMESVRQRVKRGKLKGPIMRRQNKRVIYVQKETTR